MKEVLLASRGLKGGQISQQHLIVVFEKLFVAIMRLDYPIFRIFL